ncbi:MAG: hypothetical protein SW019_11065 [Actinomycetota bacterium]|nr:hypothetical protein [Actinomycetota bacterium]
MDLVLGLSMTSSSVRWVLVEGGSGEGRTLDRGSLPNDPHQGFDAQALLSALLDRTAGRPHAIGLNWTSDAEATASAVWQELTDRGVENVIAVPDVEAAEALARGVAELAGGDRVVVCVAEPGNAVVAAVTPDGVTADRVEAAALADVDALNPDTVLVAGSGDVDGVVATLRERTDAAVVSADEADLALARGAALASEAAVSILDAQAAPARRTISRTAALASVLAAAVVTFVVSLSIALGMNLTPDNEAPQMARSVTEPVREAAPREPVEAAPPAPEAVAPPPPAAPVPAEPIAAEFVVPDAMPIVEPPAAPPLPQAPPPVYEEPIAPPPAYVPEPPAYVPPAPPPNYVPPAPAPPPAYVPPAPAPNATPPQLNTPQQPRLRDRIIERIPIINRFHEPEYDYTP